MYVCGPCVHHVYTCQREPQIPWDWSYSWFPASMCVLDVGPLGDQPGPKHGAYYLAFSPHNK